MVERGNVVQLDKTRRIERPGLMRSVPGARYTSEEFLAAEREHVFRRSWIAVCPLWRVASPGDYHCFDQVGISLMVVREGGGALHAYHNTCLHRGSRLLSGTGNATEIRCSYHGWTYALDGRVVGVPRSEGFGDVDCKALSLLPVRLETWAGFVWVNLRKDAEPLTDCLRGIAEELVPYELSDMRPIQEKVFRLPTNWKAVLENATDFYHVPFVHGRTINQHVDGGPEMVSYGDHTRQTLAIAGYGFRDRLDDVCSRGGPYTRKQKSQLHKYLVFPNFLINVLPYHLTVMQVWPTKADQCELHYAFCKRKGARGVELARVWGTLLASRYILREDLHILKRFQEGVAARQVQLQHLHDEELAAAHFQAALSRWLPGGG